MTEPVVKKFENERFSIEAIENAKCVLSLKIFVKPEETQSAYKKAVKVINKEISIPGFRKGKAPDSVIITRYSSSIDQEWKEILVNAAYRAGLELTNIYPLTKESVQRPKIEEYSQENGALITITYEHPPQLPTINFAEITLPVIVKTPVTQEAIDATLEKIRTSHPDWEDVTDRAVQEGDHVDISVDEIADPNAPSSLVQNRRFEVIEKENDPWFKTALVGMQTGETKEVETKLGQGDGDTPQLHKLKITLHAIKKKILPPVDDSLAQKERKDSLAKLLEEINSHLEENAQTEWNSSRFKALEDALLEKYPFDLPASLIEAEREEWLKEKFESLKIEELSDEEIKSQEEILERDALEAVQRKIRLYYLNKQVQKQEAITLTHEELSQELNRTINLQRYLYGKTLEKEEVRKLAANAASYLLYQKAFNRGLEKVS